MAQPLGSGPLDRSCDATTRKSSINGFRAATAIALDRHCYGAAALKQLDDADKHIAAREMTVASVVELAEVRAQDSNERHLVLFWWIQPDRAAQVMANVAQSYAEVAHYRARLRAVSFAFGLNPRLSGRGTLPAEAFGGRDRADRGSNKLKSSAAR